MKKSATRIYCKNEENLNIVRKYAEKIKRDFPPIVKDMFINNCCLNIQYLESAQIEDTDGFDSQVIGFRDGIEQGERYLKALDLLTRAETMFENGAPDVNWLREYYELTDQNMICTEDGWVSGDEKELCLQNGVEILDEVFSPDQEKEFDIPSRSEIADASSS